MLLTFLTARASLDYFDSYIIIAFNKSPDDHDQNNNRYKRQFGKLYSMAIPAFIKINIHKVFDLKYVSKRYKSFVEYIRFTIILF